MRTTIFQPAVRRNITLPERETSRAFRVVPVVDTSVYDDPDFILTIRIETFNPATGRTRGLVSTHRGHPMGKSKRWAAGMMKPPQGLRTTIIVEATKPSRIGVDLEEA